MSTIEQDIIDCKKQQKDSKIPVLSYAMLMDPELKKIFLNGATAYHVLERDKEKFENAY